MLFFTLFRGCIKNIPKYAKAGIPYTRPGKRMSRDFLLIHGLCMNVLKGIHPTAAAIHHHDLETCSSIEPRWVPIGMV